MYHTPATGAVSTQSPYHTPGAVAVSTQSPYHTPATGVVSTQFPYLEPRVSTSTVGPLSTSLSIRLFMWKTLIQVDIFRSGAPL